MLPVASPIIQMMRLVKERSEAEPTFESRQSGSAVHTLDHDTALVHLPCWSSLPCQLLNPCIHSASIFLSICTTTILVRPSLSRAHVSGITFLPSFQVLIADITPCWVLGLAFSPLYISLPWRTSHSEYSVFLFQPYTSVSLFKFSAPNIPCQHSSMELSNLDSVLASVLPGLHKLHLSTYENALSLFTASLPRSLCSLPVHSVPSIPPIHVPGDLLSAPLFFVSRQYLSVVGNRGSAAKL